MHAIYRETLSTSILLMQSTMSEVKTLEATIRWDWKTCIQIVKVDTAHRQQKVCIEIESM